MEVITVTTPFVLNVSINCYLVRISDDFILIDTGGNNKRNVVEKELENVGCHPGNMKLIVLTHGDFDHSGNAAYFREKFGSQVAMHKDDSGMVEHGDMLWNRRKKNIVGESLRDIFFDLIRGDSLFHLL